MGLIVTLGRRLVPGETGVFMMSDPGLRPLSLFFIAAGCGVLLALLVSVVTDPGRQVVASGTPRSEPASYLLESAWSGSGRVGRDP